MSNSDFCYWFVRIYLYNLLNLEKGPINSFSGCRIESFYVKVNIFFIDDSVTLYCKTDDLPLILICSQQLALMQLTYLVVPVMEAPTYGRYGFFS